MTDLIEKMARAAWEKRREMVKAEGICELEPWGEPIMGIPGCEAASIANHVREEQEAAASILLREMLESPDEAFGVIFDAMGKDTMTAMLAWQDAIRAFAKSHSIDLEGE